MPLATVLHDALGQPREVAIAAFDGSRAGPADAAATVVVKRPEAIRRLLHRPGELGVVRGFVAGDLDLDGDLEVVLRLAAGGSPLRLRPEHLPELVRAARPGWWRPLEPPPEESRVRGRLHSRARDAEAISHHYDVSNDFYRLVLGPAMTYSCAVFQDPSDDLTTAQANKHELVCQKLGLEPGSRVLNVGCGWGSMLIHAASNHGVRGVGITISQRQAELAQKRAAEAGVGDLVEIRLQDYRDIDDEPFDAVSSVGMFEHVGRAHMPEYDQRLFELVRPGGRVLNHGICRPPHPRGTTVREHLGANVARVATAVGSPRFTRIRSPLMERYVFPDAELHDVGTIVELMEEVGFEVRHVENLREHYALTLRHWVQNLEDNWDAAVASAGIGRARVWRLYMAASAIGFDVRLTEIHQVLAVRPERGRSEMPLRPHFD